MAESSHRPPAEITLTGILATSDSNDRLRLCLLEKLPSREARGAPDMSWQRLKEAIPYTQTFSVPYHFPMGGAPDDIGVRGDCWITVPGGAGRAAKERRARILALAKELRGKEVSVVAKPKRYSYQTRQGETRSGTMLHLVTLEPLK